MQTLVLSFVQTIHQDPLAYVRVVGTILASFAVAQVLHPRVNGVFWGKQSVLFGAVNCTCLLGFSLSTAELTSRYLRAGLEGSYDPLVVALAFGLLVYLVGAFSVAAVMADLVTQAKDTSSLTILGLPLILFISGAWTTLVLQDTTVARAGISTAAVVLITALFQAIRYANDHHVQRNGKDFKSTLVGTTRLLSNSDSVLKRDGVNASYQHYDDLFSGARKTVGEISSEESIDKRKKEYDVMVSSFYDLVTDFYEYGWGQSFHFARRHEDESFESSLARAEHYLACTTHMNKDSYCLDMGCGVGGPMRSLARFVGAKIKGITINQYQVNVANRYNKEKGLADQCHVVQGDFMNLPFKDNEFDIVYAIESTCHAPDRVPCFKETLRCLKPGGVFVGYDWVMCGEYDPKNKRHVELKEGIEVGNGLPTLVEPRVIVENLEAAGFIVEEHFNMMEGHKDPHEIPWYATLKGTWTLSGFRMTTLGRFCTHMMVSVLETLRIAPKGSTRVSKMLNSTADDIVAAGEMGIFTPAYFFKARKPIAE